MRNQGGAGGREKRNAVDVGGTPAAVRVHAAGPRDREGAPDVIPEMPEKAPEVTGLWADSGYRGGKPRAKLVETGVPEALEIVERPKGTKGFTVPYRRRAVECAFAWMSRCRRLARRLARDVSA